ncbi:MAG: FkbM family methyltransferase [Geobacter sp.]|nr:FkbM family methyltransferase [Geobacter sp.]
MSFISYSQNAEDVMLWRALRHIRNGFYIDVGANDPVIDSVTKAFYDRGWRGINIEPVPRHYDDLVAQRPDDRNLQLAAGTEPGSLTLYEVKEVRGWGTLDAAMAEQYQQQGHQLIELPVTVMPLAEICQAHVTGEIHFLKIDAEGAEEQVMRGMDFSRWRPWIVIAESRVPAEEGTVTAAWESLLTTVGYTAVYFDGINTFYLADEHRHALQQAFHAPPNILDDFVRFSEWESGRYAEKLEKHYADQRRHIQQLEVALQQADQQLAQQQQLLTRWNAREQEFSASEQQIAAQEQQIAAQEQQIAAQEQQIAALYASSSWKVTAPLRAVRRLLGGQRG